MKSYKGVKSTKGVKRPEHSLWMKQNHPRPTLGKKFTKEWKEKISQAITGKKRSIDFKMKCQVSKLGNKNPAWKGGVSDINHLIRTSAEYKLWRISVFERDHYCCIWCGQKGGWNKKEKRQIILNADHIKPFSLFPELRFAIDNGRTLGIDCHKKTPTWGRIFTNQEMLF